MWEVGVWDVSNLDGDHPPTTKVGPCSHVVRSLKRKMLVLKPLQCEYLLFRATYSDSSDCLRLLGAEEGSRGESYPVGRGGDDIVKITWLLDCPVRGETGSAAGSSGNGKRSARLSLWADGELTVDETRRICAEAGKDPNKMANKKEGKESFHDRGSAFLAGFCL